MDQALSQAVVINLNIVMWRSYWNILDDGIMPDQYDLSSGICLAVGAVATLILMFLSIPAAKYSATLDYKRPIAKVAFEDFFNLFVFGTTVMY